MADIKTIGIAAILSLILSGSVMFIGEVNQDNPTGAYYCESRNLIIDCDEISSGKHTRCYFDDTYKICNEGWYEITGDIEVAIQTKNIGKRYTCTPNKCELII